MQASAQVLNWPLSLRQSDKHWTAGLPKSAKGMSSDKASTKYCWQGLRVKDVPEEAGALLLLVLLVLLVLLALDDVDGALVGLGAELELELLEAPPPHMVCAEPAVTPAPQTLHATMLDLRLAGRA